MEITEELRAVHAVGFASEEDGYANTETVGASDTIRELSVPKHSTSDGIHGFPDWRAAREKGISALDLLPVSPDSDSPTENQELSGEERAEWERRIYALRSRLSRIGPVNPLAMEEHAALSQRHDYLRVQLDDLAGAAESLRQIIAELDRTMSEQFAITFAEVNREFGAFFGRMFGGGNAQLELTDPGNVTQTGIEISAQPPGKRMQPLAAISGGERALTAGALLFALLKVRPVPFCVLDEVDAALDESNVTRFRSALQELGARTQFVVVTHNRGTIEAADTLYGVSMAGDGTSKLLSLKVEVEAAAAS